MASLPADPAAMRNLSTLNVVCCCINKHEALSRVFHSPELLRRSLRCRPEAGVMRRITATMSQSPLHFLYRSPNPKALNPQPFLSPSLAPGKGSSILLYCGSPATPPERIICFVFLATCASWLCRLEIRRTSAGR